LSSYLEKKKGHKPWKLTDLKNKDFILNLAPGKGMWRLTALPFCRLLSVPEEMMKGAKEAAPPPERLIQIPNLKRPLTGKQASIWSYLQRERVGETLLVNVEHVDKMAAEAGCSRTSVWLALARFEELKLVKRSRPGPGQGLLITFRAAGAGKFAASNLLETIDSEIAELESMKNHASSQIAKLQEILRNSETELAKKTLVREEIKRLAGIAG
jgi:hypothetical protein